MHQDVFSEKYCGDGMPLWLVEDELKEYPLPVSTEKFTWDNTTGRPENCTKFEENWGEYYFSYSVAVSFEKLYTTHA